MKKLLLIGLMALISLTTYASANTTAAANTTVTKESCDATIDSAYKSLERAQFYIRTQSYTLSTIEFNMVNDELENYLKVDCLSFDFEKGSKEYLSAQSRLIKDIGKIEGYAVKSKILE